MFDTLDKNSVENWFLSLLEKNKLYKQTYYIINNSTNNLVSLNFLNKSLLVIINYYKEFKEKGIDNVHVLSAETGKGIKEFSDLLVKYLREISNLDEKND